MLHKKLDELEINYEKQKELTGTPDIFIKPNICIFADGDYWHAHPKWFKSVDIHKRTKRKVQDIWDRDKYVSDVLCDQGYIVLRFWGETIRGRIDECVDIINIAINKRLGVNYIKC